MFSIRVLNATHYSECGLNSIKYIGDWLLVACSCGGLHSTEEYGLVAGKEVEVRLGRGIAQRECLLRNTLQQAIFGAMQGAVLISVSAKRSCIAACASEKGCVPEARTRIRTYGYSWNLEFLLCTL